MAKLPQLGTPFGPDRAEVIRDQILSDIRLEGIKNGVEPAVNPQSDNWWFATGHANAAMAQYSNIELSRDAITPLNATGQDLENWRLALGLPEVEASPAAGKIRLTVTGTATVPADEQIVLPNGLRAKVVGTWIGVTDGSEIDIIAIDTGEQTNIDAGETVRFVAAPTNVATEAEVSQSEPLSGGFDDENDDRKRIRVLNALANKPGGGNWGQLRQIALDELASVQDCFVYPALGGSGSVKIVPVRDFDPSRDEFTRVPTSAALAVIRNAIHRDTPDSIQKIVMAPANEPVDVALSVTIPDSTLSGGNGQGWLDQNTALWPQLEVADSGRVTVSSKTSTTQVTLSANTATAPIAGQSHIAWWSPTDRRFYVFLVTAQSGSAGAWVVTVDRPMVDSTGAEVDTGHFISPAAVNMTAYGTSWINAMRELGPGEMTTDANRIPRAARKPLTDDERPHNLTFRVLEEFRDKHPEISDLSWGYRSKTAPTVPASVDSAPNVLTPQNFGIYKAT